MNIMKTKLHALIAFLFSAFILNAQETTVNLTLNPGYADQVYYKLSTETETTFDKDSWDVAFLRVSVFDLGVRVNDGRGIIVYEAANTPAGYDTVDVTEEATWTRLYNDDTNWSNGAFMQTSLTGPLAFGFGNYNTANNTVEGQIVFVLKYQDGSYKKFFIESYFGGYTFKYASWTGTAWTADITENIPNTNNPNNRFNYYSLENEAEVVAEPAATDWDFVFRKYDSYLVGPGQYYNVTGALHNPNVEVAENDEPGGIPANPSLTYSDDINTIGHDWKTFGGMGFVVDSDKAYYVKYTVGTVYRLYFNTFGGSTSGNLSFTFGDVTSILNVEDVNENVSFGIYPNPSTDKKINLVYDVSNINGSLQNQVVIYSTTGKKVYQTVLNNNSGFFNKTLDLSSLSDGVYVLQFTSGESTITRKVILK